MNKKDDSITLLEFSRIKNYPVFGRLAILFGFMLGLIGFYFTEKIWIIFLLTGLGAALYVFFALRYRCPDCRGFLWYLKDKSTVKRCPNCQALLREGPDRSGNKSCEKRKVRNSKREIK